jgi:hypothetical protein
MPQRQFPVFCYFCVSEKLHRKYSRNWTKQKPNIQKFTEASRSLKRRWRGATGQPHSRAVRPSPWLPIPNNASKKYAFGVPLYTLRQQSKLLAKERIEIHKRKDSAIAASDTAHRARSDASYKNGKRHHWHGSRYENLEYSDRQSLSKNLDSSFLSVDEQGNIIPKTPKVALVAAQAYLHTTRPSTGDPRKHMHRASLQGLKMVGNKLSAKEEEAYCNKGIHKPRSPRRHNSPRHRSGSRRSRMPSPGQHKSPKHKGTR